MRRRPPNLSAMARPHLLLSLRPFSTISASLSSTISAIAADLLSLPDQSDPSPILESHSFSSILKSTPDGSASIHLLSLLKPRPLLALDVFSWRRKLSNKEIPLLSEEYAKAISLAGRAKDLDLAAALFSESVPTFSKPSSIYNALMSAYMINGLTRRCVSVFESLRRDPRCEPTIVSYNILLSLFGRLLLVDHMEAVLRAADESGMARNLETYNTLIAAYVTAWMWDRMETAFRSMQAGPVKPDINTYLLVLRGYAHSGNIVKMEKTYKYLREKVGRIEVPIIRAMICAYCKNSHPYRIQRVEELMEHIDCEKEYRPWLNVLLIKAYAQEGLVELMERFISQALERNTTVSTAGIMRSISSSYFRSDMVDRLAGFVKKAEEAGWRMCRTLFHCRMALYGRHNRMEEMHQVLHEMEMFGFGRNRKTLLIMYKSYFYVGRRYEAETVIGLMWKYGLGSPNDDFVFR